MKHQKYSFVSFYVLFDLFDYFCPSQQYFSHVRMVLPWLTSTKQKINCLAQGHNAVPPVRLKPATFPS